jgi:hypothetical protein
MQIELPESKKFEGKINSVIGIVNNTVREIIFNNNFNIKFF